LAAAVPGRQIVTGKIYNDRKTEAARIGIGERTLDRRSKEGQFPFIRFGGRLLFDPEMTDRYLASCIHNGRAAELAHQIAA